jgi:hypothetical protein
MKSSQFKFFSLLLRSVTALVISYFAQACMAGEGAFGWVYTLDLQPKGTWEFEQRLQRNHGQASGKYDVWLSRTELEYGLTNDLQIAGYINSYSANVNQNYTNPEICGQRATCTAGFPVPVSHTEQSPDQAYRASGVDGFSLELIYRLTNPVTSPIGVGFYVEPTFGKLKNELETRLLLQSNFLDDSLIVAGNVVFANEQLKFLGEGNTPESMLDVLMGVSYRFQPKWFAGLEGRWHNDFGQYNLKSQTQRAFFWGPNVHYAEKSWWMTAAMRYQPKGGTCMGNGTGECSDGRVWDSHSKTEMMFKFGFPMN